MAQDSRRLKAARHLNGIARVGREAKHRWAAVPTISLDPDRECPTSCAERAWPDSQRVVRLVVATEYRRAT
eukprot:8989786-Pyramimonas_sp.AAC.1